METDLILKTYVLSMEDKMAAGLGTLGIMGETTTFLTKLNYRFILFSKQLRKTFRGMDNFFARFNLKGQR